MTLYWKNWSTRDDLVSLAQWERLFGRGFCGLFVFAYNVLGERTPLAYVRDNFDWRDLRGLGKMFRSMFSIPQSQARSAL